MKEKRKERGVTRRRNIHYKPSKSASMLSGVIACARGVFGLCTIPSIGAMIGFKAIWCLMAFGMGIYNFLLAAGVVKYNGGYEITDETDDGAKERKSDAEVRLEELQTLYDRRLITEEEYQEKRRDILDRL